jgi:hypothetical protein
MESPVARPGALGQDEHADAEDQADADDIHPRLVEPSNPVLFGQDAYARADNHEADTLHSIGDACCARGLTPVSNRARLRRRIEY